MIDNRTAPYAAFVLRIALGLMFITHAALNVWAEFLGGVLIVAGLYSRWVSAALVPVLLGAT